MQFSPVGRLSSTTTEDVVLMVAVLTLGKILLKWTEVMPTLLGKSPRVVASGFARRCIVHGGGSRGVPVRQASRFSSSKVSRVIVEQVLTTRVVAKHLLMKVFFSELYTAAYLIL
ncbi:hypothetical protein L6452_37183 [Arctium lappa]|uniref:Uncharacterized protein n=1 Tax=Arctium lappa TaxID=4217 RepID=A0ACB8Y6G3_ARCLA|nr:hypothetical protein L6452_37183 [Arctium lappa]